MSLDNATIGKLNADFVKDFSKTLSDILTSKQLKIEEDLAIAYDIRNFAAHRLEDQPVLYQNMEELFQRLLNALFFSIEKLYVVES